MADLAGSVPGIQQSDLLSRFRDLQGNPDATADDMFANVMGIKVAVAAYNAFVARVDNAIEGALTRVGILEAGGTTFVATGAMTTANLLANYPASASNLGKYARVNDLYGFVDDVLRCRYDGTNYRWVPQRADFNTTTATTGNVSLIPLVTAPTIKIGGTLTGAMQFAPSVVNAYIGQRFRIVTGGLGIYLATVTNLVGSNLTLLGNKTTDLEYSAGGWFAVSG